MAAAAASAAATTMRAPDNDFDVDVDVATTTALPPPPDNAAATTTTTTTMRSTTTKDDSATTATTAPSTDADVMNKSTTTSPPVRSKPSSIGGPKNKMAATWHNKPRSDWTFHERALSALGILQDPAGSDRPPIHAKTDPVRVYPVWRQHVWIFPRAMLPLLVHSGFMWGTGKTVPAYVAGPLYLAYFLAYGMDVFNFTRRMSKRYGFFDGAAERDGIPDVDTTHVAVGLINVILFRALFGFSIIYDPTTLPLPSFWLPVQLAVYAIIIDFWFYIYHRLMHDVDFLWKFHRKHHTTKHPNAALGAFADHEQELFDILVIPVLSWLVYPVDFPTWWCSMVYVLYIEAAGHSGLRGVFQNPTTWFLRYFDCELVLEDHDIHHRQGWKKSGNYGKQTRLWDTIFGTKMDRIEGTKDRIDWDNPIVTV